MGDADRTHLRIYEVLPLVCLHCGGQMRIIAFILDGADAHQQWDPSARSAPEYQVDQRIDW